MCGRYTMASDADVLRGLFALTGDPGAVAPRWNVAPTQTAPVVPNEEPRALRPFRWGLVPPWAKDPAIGARMINARAETVAEKPSFRTAFRRHRCAVPATGFYEWRREPGGRTPFLFRARDGAPFAMAGLRATWVSPGGEVVDSFAVVTTEANALLRGFHDRMPVILDAAGIDRWLAPEPAAPGDLLPLLRPAPAPLLEAVPVSRHVNDARHDDPGCIVPVGPAVRVDG